MRKYIIILLIVLIVLIMIFIGIYLMTKMITNNNESNINNEDRKKNDLNENIIVNNEVNETMKLYLNINDKTLIAALENNTSVDALIEKLKQNDITINMKDYANFEKVGSLGFNLPRNDKQITTEPGDIILYQGNSLTIYYDTNSWNFTKIGKIENVSENELKEILGDGDVKVTISLNN